MQRGRPLGSEVRQNILTILHYLKKGYGYEIYAIYREIFPKVTMRLIYYHLKKGVQLKEIDEKGIEMEKGDYSWGQTAEKVYYSLGPKAAPKENKKVKTYIMKKRSSKK